MFDSCLHKVGSCLDFFLFVAVSQKVDLYDFDLK